MNAKCRAVLPSLFWWLTLAPRSAKETGVAKGVRHLEKMEGVKRKLQHALT